MKGDKGKAVWLGRRGRGGEGRRRGQTEGLSASSKLSPPLVGTVREDGGQFNRSVEQKVEGKK